MSYLISADYGHGSDYVCVVIGEYHKDVIHIIGEGWHLKSKEVALEIAINTVRPRWKQLLIRWQLWRNLLREVYQGILPLVGRADRRLRRCGCAVAGGGEMSKWKMPKWMERYRSQIVNTGGNRIEDMMNGNADPRVNLPLSTLQACVKSQIALLYRLDAEKLLTKLAK